MFIFTLSSTNKQEHLSLFKAIEAGVDMIVSGAGLPMTLPVAAGKAKTKLVPIVSSVKSAHVICKYWLKKYDRLPDAIVIEGPKAGGHLGFSLEDLEKLNQQHFLVLY